MEKVYYVYLLADHPGGLIYVGITNDMERRIFEHKQELFEGFTKRYHIHSLVYYESYESPKDAIAREKQLKYWKRAWKMRLIAASNPKWRDLSKDF